MISKPEKKTDTEIEELLSKNLDKNFIPKVTKSDMLDKIPGTRTAHMDIEDNKKAIMERINRMKKNLHEEAKLEKLYNSSANDKLMELMSEDPAFLPQKELNKKYPPGKYAKNIKTEYETTSSEKSYVREKRFRGHNSSRSRSNSRERSNERSYKKRRDDSSESSRYSHHKSREYRYKPEMPDAVESRLGPPIKRRSRSKSPFVEAMENWDKYKRAEGAMLSQIETKRKFFMKRPEDHPDYAQEWKAFWKRRYAELVQKGADPNTYDFKSEWIPYWENRIMEVFDEDLQKKMADLMQKYNLTTVEKPRREDYKRRTPTPDLSPSPPPRKEDFKRGREESYDRHGRRGRDDYDFPPEKRRYNDISPPARGFFVDYQRNHQSLSPQRSPTRRPRLTGAALPPPASARNRSPDQHPDHNNPWRDGRRNPDGHSRPSWDQPLGRESPSQPHNRSRRSRSRERMRWNPSPPGQKYSMTERGQTGPSRIDSQRSDLYSGLTELEDRRDRGRTSSISPPDQGSLKRSMDFHKRDTEVDVTSVLRILSALEDSLGSLGPAVNKILAKSLSLEQSRPGTSRVMMEDPDIVSILDMVKEKLSGQVMAGLLSGSKEGAVRVSLDKLTLLLQKATKKRSINPLEALLSSSNSEAETKTKPSLFKDTQAVNKFFANAISTVLVCTKRHNLSETELEELVTQLMSETEGLTLDEDIIKVAKDYNAAVKLEKELKAKAEREEWVRKLGRTDLLQPRQYKEDYYNEYNSNYDASSSAYDYGGTRRNDDYSSGERRGYYTVKQVPPSSEMYAGDSRLQAQAKAPPETICLDDDDDDEGYSKPGPSHTRLSADRGYSEDKSADRGYPKEEASAQSYDRNAPAAATSQENIEALDEGEDFTIDELKSLLQNFDFLSGTEQSDLMNYVKKLERRKPEMLQALLPLIENVRGKSQDYRRSTNYERGQFLE